MSAFISLNNPKTATGSVALMRAPNAKHALNDRLVTKPVYPTAYVRKEVVIVEISVPIIANANIEPIFLKNNALSILIALSNKIGGNSMIIKKSLNPP